LKRKLIIHSLSPDDILSRFLFFRSEINFTDKKIKTSAITGKHDKGFSVFHTTDLNDDSIWGLANDHVVDSYKDQGRDLLGRFDIETSYYTNASLEIKENIPPPRHHDVFGMPLGSALEEADKLSKRQKFVLKSRLHLL